MTVADNSKLIHELMRSARPVTVDGIQYDRIAEYISWYDNHGNHHLSVNLIHNNFSIRVPAEKITLQNGGETS